MIYKNISGFRLVLEEKSRCLIGKEVVCISTLAGVGWASKWRLATKDANGIVNVLAQTNKEENLSRH